MSQTKLAEVRFYVDADMLGLAKVLASLRIDVTYPGDPGKVIKRRQRLACPIASPSVLDPVWIPEVTVRGWLILTRDRHIQDHRAEIAAVKESGARMVTLAGGEAIDTWHQLEIVMRQWRAIERCLDEAGLFIYAATRTTFRRVDL